MQLLPAPPGRESLLLRTPVQTASSAGLTSIDRLRSSQPLMSRRPPCTAPHPAAAASMQPRSATRGTPIQSTNRQEGSSPRVLPTRPCVPHPHPPTSKKVVHRPCVHHCRTPDETHACCAFPQPISNRAAPPAPSPVLPPLHAAPQKHLPAVLPPRPISNRAAHRLCVAAAAAPHRP